MTEAVDVVSRADGALVVHPRGVVGADCAPELRRMLVHAVRRMRPSRLILDLRDVSHLDSINVGTLAAACSLCDDHHVSFRLDNIPASLTGRLAAAGIPRQLMHRPPSAAVPYACR